MLLTLEKGIKPVSDDVKKLSTHTVITLILSFFFFFSDCFEDLLEGLDDDDDLLDEALLL